MTTIKFRRGTAAQWASSNPVLASGEPGFETDTGKIKFGNGTSAWATLPYGGGGTTTGGGDVTSVNGKTGIVVLTQTDVGLSLVDNTTDATKPVSTAQAAAIATAAASAVTYARLPAGTPIVVDYYKAGGINGNANAWPSARPHTRTDCPVIWMGPSDPGDVLADAGDTFKYVVS